MGPNNPTATAALELGPELGKRRGAGDISMLVNFLLKNLTVTNKDSREGAFCEAPSLSIPVEGMAFYSQQ